MVDKITIGITCFNAEDTISRAIKAALQQEWSNLEIIIVDDGSSDNSVSIIKETCKGHDNITFIPHEKNKGFPSALNTIMNHASGEYIAFFDDDDGAASKRLQIQYDRITNYKTQHPEASIVLCYANRDVYLPNSNQPDHTAFAIGRKPTEPHGPMVADYILLDIGQPQYCWGMFGSCTLMARLEDLKQVMPFDSSFRRGAELDMAIRASFAGAHFIACDEPLVKQHKTYTSDKSNKIIRYHMMQLREKHKNYLKQKRAYLASKVIAATATRHQLFYYCGLLLACVLAPHTILKEKLNKIWRS